MEGVSDETVGLTDVPASVLKDQVLRLLDYKTLCALACSGSPWLRDTCDSDSVWQQLAKAKSWERRGQVCGGCQETWKQAYKRQHAELCVCCHNYTKYVFAITGCRLCEACEHANPQRYALVTACEVTEHYGLSSPHLLSLTGPLKKLGTSFYLRCEVARAAAVDCNTCFDPDNDDDDGADVCQAQLADGPSFKSSSLKQSREERRAARKVNKMQVK